MSVLALIPARGQSKGVKRKNLRYLRGEPLIFWTIRSAQQAAGIDQVVVSTEDSEIAGLARLLGVEEPLMRPPELAEDTTPGVAPVLHAAAELPEFSWILVLQPTSPLRSVADIDGILEFQRSTAAKSVVSVSPVLESPQLFFSLGIDKTLTPLLPEASSMGRRQDFPQFHKLNGAMYLVERDWLLQNRALVSSSTLGYEMPPERSIDIDSHDDFERAELLMGAMND
jgi:CMP-N-acetylneuraminic acid synthetase